MNQNQIGNAIFRHLHATGKTLLIAYLIERKTCISELRNEIKTKRNESYLTKNSNIAKLGAAHKDTNTISDSCQILDLDFSNSIVRFNTLVYDKRGDFSFLIVNDHFGLSQSKKTITYHLLAQSYDVYISQVYRFHKLFTTFTNFNYSYKDIV